MTFADDGAWHRFTVQAGEPVSVVVNPEGTTPRLEITTRSGRGNFCPAEADDDVSRRDGQTLYLSGCAEGEATVVLRRQSDGTVLNTYTFEVTGSPVDLVVESVSVSDSTLTPGQSFTLRATVRNQGTGRSAATTLRYYRSSNRTISTRDTGVGTGPVGALGASRTSAESISLTAPSSAGTWYYGACVVGVRGESAGNNCSAGVRVRVEAASPDLVVQSVSVSDSSLTPGQSFTLSATVRNQGTGASATTTLRWYRSTDATLSRRDTHVGTDEVRALAASDSSAASITLAAPSDEGTYYYGACVVSLAGEANPRDNCSAAVTVSVAGTPPVSPDRDVLVALYHATDGPNWINSTNWLSDTPLDDWHGVRVSNGRVTALYLSENNLRGQISPELAQLTNLEALGLRDNQLTGTIPAELRQLTNLTQLWLGHNQLTGTIPTELGQLTNLTHLSLGYNQLMGTIPIELIQLTDLATLQLPGNQLTGAIPAGLALTKLNRLSLGENQLTGTIPEELGQLTNLTYLALNHNQLTGSIPADLGQLTNLTHLSLDFNQLTGPIPKELGQLANLTQLSLGYNQLTGPIPKELGQLANLTGLPLIRNQLTGTIPEELGQLKNLTGLSLAQNELTGTIPKALGQLANLTQLSLGFNQLTGPIPRELGQLTNLTHLIIPNNQLTGTIPKELGQLKNLTWITLSANQLTGSVPGELGQLTNLTVLALSDNKLTGLPSLAGLTRLTELWLWGNDITDISSLTGLTSLTLLSLGLNKVRDLSSLEDLTSLTELFLGGNNVTDISSLAGLSGLTKLDLADNRITDISPLAGLTNLTHLSVAYNNFANMDVSPLSRLTRLAILDLPFNGITEISALTGLTSLENLDLRGNPLSDTSIARDVSALENRGVAVRFDSFRKGNFDIDLVFPDSFEEKHKNMLRYVGRRWMAVIADDLPDYELAGGWSGGCGEQSYTISSGQRIDDLRIFMTTFEGEPDQAVGWGGPLVLRDGSHLPVLGCMGFDLERANLEITGLHETGHVLGFVSELWREFGYHRNPPNGDTHFGGPRAIAAFDDAGGRGYRGAKVPLQGLESHWRNSVFPYELMRSGGGDMLSAITVQSLADLGYGVDLSQADPYTVASAAGKASAKIATARPSIPGGDVTRADAHGRSGSDRRWQGRIGESLPSLSGDRLKEGLEGPEWIGMRGVDLRDDRHMGRLAGSSRAVSQLSCGAGFRRGPIQVVDPQGRIVRTLGH